MGLPTLGYSFDWTGTTRRVSRKSRTLSLLAAIVLASSAAGPAVAAAQETVNYASVSGRVSDSQGAMVPGAHVVARQLETDVKAEAVTSSDGRFRFPYLRVGSYEVKVTLQGFAESRTSLKLSVGSAFDLPVTLQVAGIDSNVTVSGEAPLLETARRQTAGTVSQAEIQNLPMNGRNFLDLALLMPGVSPTNVGSNQLFAETSAVAGQGISIASQRNFSNSFIVDGLSANDDAAGLSGMPQGVDAVEQFQVVTSGGQAELGRALGGYINVVTKSGTNTVRGTVYGYFRDDSLNEQDSILKRVLPMNQDQFGGSVGGPIKRGQTFYFTNLERKVLDQSGLTTILDANVPVINQRLESVGFKGMPVATGIYANPVHSSTYLGKIDHAFSGTDQLSVRYNFYDVYSSNARGAGALNAPSGSTFVDNADHAVAFGNTWTLSSNTVNETRAQVAHGFLQAPSRDQLGPNVNISGVAVFGTFSSSPTSRKNTMYEVVNNLSHQAGAHALRAGFDFLRNDDTITFLRSFRGAYTFSSLANFLTGNYSGFSQTFGDPVTSQTNPNLGIYAQDEWRVASGLTVNFGLRYDLQSLNSVSTDTNNVSPRLGIVWSPSPGLLIRGNGGIFFDRVPLRAVANALLSAGNSTDPALLHQPSVSGLLPTQTGAPVFPNILADRLITGTLVDFTTMDKNLQNAYSKQAGVEVERSLGKGRTVSVGYEYIRGEDLLMSINQNVPTCVAAGANNGCRPVANYRNNSRYSAVGDSNYHGMHVSFMQRPADWANVRLTYTLSKSMNDMGEAFFSSPVDPTDVMRDWGRSDNDQRHRLVVSGSVMSSIEPARNWWGILTHGFQVSPMLQYYSSLPFNIVSGVTSLQGTNGRPFADGSIATANFDVRTAALIPRNAGTGSDFFSLNMRVGRSIRVAGGMKIEGTLEAFNLTNHVNAVTRNTTWGTGAYPTTPSSTFNQITAVGEPRTVQLGARLTF